MSAVPLRSCAGQLCHEGFYAGIVRIRLAGHSNFARMPNRKSSALDIREMERGTRPPSQECVSVPPTMVSVLSTISILNLLSAQAITNIR